MYLELKEEEAARACNLLTQQFVTLIASGESLREMKVEDYTQTCTDIIVYRIHLTEKVGRFEQSYY